MPYLYQIQFPNKKLYIGLTVNPSRRWKKHRALASMGHDLPVYQAMRKYGIDNIKFVVIKEGPLDEIKQLEIDTISELKTCIPVHGKRWGYNISLGGDTGPNLWGKDHPMYGNHSRSGENHPMYGKHHTPEVKERLRQVQLTNPSRGMLGKTHSLEARIKQAGNKLGKPLSEEHKSKIGRKGEANASSKLTENQVLRILVDPRPLTHIAKDYGVSSVLIGKIKKRTSWSHVQLRI